MSSDTGAGGTPPKSAEALEADIRRTQQELSDTVDALVAKTDLKARAQQRATEVAGNLRSRAHIAIDKARGEVRDAQEKAAGHRPALQGTTSVRVYSVAAAAALTGAIILAWLTARRRGRSR